LHAARQHLVVFNQNDTHGPFEPNLDSFSTGFVPML